MVNVKGWFHYWQELIGAILGAAAITSTVWFTLRSERRKQDAEAVALRQALGAEIRQIAARGLHLHRGIVGIISQLRVLETTVDYGRVKREVLFTDPVIYPHSAAGLGALGEHAFSVVYFYNQLALVRALVKQFESDALVPMRQLANIADGLLNVAERAVDCLPAFAGTCSSEHDDKFAEEVALERESFDPLFAGVPP